MLNNIVLVIEDQEGTEFLLLLAYLESKYGAVIKLLPYVWTFKSEETAIQIMDSAEEFLMDHKALCFTVEPDIAITTNMSDLL